MAVKVPCSIGKLIKKVFGVSDSCFYVLLLALLGGYPVGASSIKTLYKENLISETDSKRAAMFCVASGPGFLVTYIGAAMTRNVKLGYILLVSQTISVLILGIIAKNIIKPDIQQVCPNQKRNSSVKSIKGAFVSSVEASIKSCSKMCALVVIFGSITEIFSFLCYGSPSVIWLSALLEITNGVKILSTGYPAVLISFMCGFGGLCVHLQIFTELEGINISKSIFWIFRIMQGILNAVITYIFLKFFPITQSVFSSVENAEAEFYTTSVGCIALIAVCIVFIISVKNKSYTKHTI